MSDSTHVGIHLTGDSLDVCTSAGESWRCPNNADGVATIIQRLRGRNVACIVLAASGGDATQVAQQLTDAYLPVTRVNADHLRHLAKTRRRPWQPATSAAVRLMRIARAIKPEAADPGFLIRAY